MSKDNKNKTNSIEERMEKIRTRIKKTDKSKLFGKILAGILAVLMILSIAATCIYAIINMLG